MPVLMPTSQELQSLPPAKRERIRRAILRIMADVDGVAEEALQTRRRRLHDGDAIRELARLLEVNEPRDSAATIQARRLALLEAIA